MGCLLFSKTYIYGDNLYIQSTHLKKHYCLNVFCLNVCTLYKKRNVVKWLYNQPTDSHYRSILRGHQEEQEVIRRNMKFYLVVLTILVSTILSAPAQSEGSVVMVRRDNLGGLLDLEVCSTSD